MDLDIGRVVAIHPEDYSVDIVMIKNGQRYPGIQVMGWTASSNSGANDLPDPGLPPSGDQWSLTEAFPREIRAVVAVAGGQMIVMGFLYPQICEMLFKDHDRRVNRHASDVYSTIDSKANMELAHPSGFYMRVGTSSAHEDLTGKDVDGKWKIAKNTAANVHFHLQMGGNTMSLNVAPNGDVQMDTQGKLLVNVEGTAEVNEAQGAAAAGGVPRLDVHRQGDRAGPVHVHLWHGRLRLQRGLGRKGGADRRRYALHQRPRHHHRWWRYQGGHHLAADPQAPDCTDRPCERAHPLNVVTRRWWHEPRAPVEPKSRRAAHQFRSR